MALNPSQSSNLEQLALKGLTSESIGTQAHLENIYIVGQRHTGVTSCTFATHNIVMIVELMMMNRMYSAYSDNIVKWLSVGS